MLFLLFDYIIKVWRYCGFTKQIIKITLMCIVKGGQKGPLRIRRGWRFRQPI